MVKSSPNPNSIATLAQSEKAQRWEVAQRQKCNTTCWRKGTGEGLRSLKDIGETGEKRNTTLIVLRQLNRSKRGPGPICGLRVGSDSAGLRSGLPPTTEWTVRPTVGQIN